MSDLQLALVIVGVLLVLAVVGYNKWQEARYRKQAEAGLKSGHTDVLLRSTAEAPMPAAPRVEPTWGVQGGAPALRTSPAGMLSEAIDYIVVLSPPAEVDGRTFLETALPALRLTRKSLRLEGYADEAWETVRPERRYGKLRLGLQLEDRGGPAREEDIAAFSAAAEAVAVKLGAEAEPADRATALATAARLDRFCEQVDIQIALHVTCPGGAFEATQVHALAQALGLALEKDGRFRRRDDQAAEVFSLSNAEAQPFPPAGAEDGSIKQLSLELDVPRAPGGADAFRQFRDFAEKFAAGAGGVLVDDNHAPLGPSSFDAILQQLDPVYEAMRAQGIPAGSPLALRLFS